MVFFSDTLMSMTMRPMPTFYHDDYKLQEQHQLHKRWKRSLPMDDTPSKRIKTLLPSTVPTVDQEDPLINQEHTSFMVPPSIPSASTPTVPSSKLLSPIRISTRPPNTEYLESNAFLRQLYVSRHGDPEAPDLPHHPMSDESANNDAMDVVTDYESANALLRELHLLRTARWHHSPSCI